MSTGLFGTRMEHILASATLYCCVAWLEPIPYTQSKHQSWLRIWLVASTALPNLDFVMYTASPYLRTECEYLSTCHRPLWDNVCKLEIKWFPIGNGSSIQGHRIGNNCPGKVHNVFCSNIRRILEIWKYMQNVDPFDLTWTCQLTSSHVNEWWIEMCGRPNAKLQICILEYYDFRWICLRFMVLNWVSIVLVHTKDYLFCMKGVWGSALDCVYCEHKSINYNRSLPCDFGAAFASCTIAGNTTFEVLCDTLCLLKVIRIHP